MGFYIKKMIKKNFLTKIVFVLFLVMFLFPTLLLGNSQTGSNPDIYELPPPIRAETISEFLIDVSNFLLLVGGSLILLMILVGAIYIMFGGANPNYVQKGKNIIVWVIIGLFVLLFTRAILWFINYIIS